MALDRATVKFLEELAEAGGKPLAECTPQEARASGADWAEFNGPAPEMAGVEEHAIPTAAGEVPIRVLVPTQRPLGVLVYYHGGGWVTGSIDESDTVAKKLAERTSCAVVLVGYRLAPEHRYPTAVDDSYAALEWAGNHLADIAGRDAPLIVAGDSAGGNLAAVMALRSRDRVGPTIALQALIYPVTDADFSRPSYDDRGATPYNSQLLSREAMIWYWDHYLPDQSRRTEPDASPLRAGDFSGLPGCYTDRRARCPTGRGRGLRGGPAGRRRAGGFQKIPRPDPRVLYHFSPPRQRVGIPTGRECGAGVYRESAQGPAVPVASVPATVDRRQPQMPGL